MNYIKPWIFKFFILLFWLSIIIVFLYFPKKLLLKKAGCENTLNIYCWSEIIDPGSIKEFENQTGIKINLSYYEQNYELFSKLNLTKARDYDLLMVTDFALSYLKEKNLLKELDKSKLEFWDKLAPEILNKSFDLQNKYSIPYVWDIYVIGYNKKCFNKIKDEDINNKNLDIIFNPKKIKPYIAMLDEASEAFSFAVQYKFLDKFNYKEKTQWHTIKDILIKQKKFVEAYTDSRGGNLLTSGSVCATLSQSAHIARAQKTSEDIGIYIPEPHSFFVVDSFVISKATKKDPAIYKFLNFIYNKNYLKLISKRYMYLPVNKELLHELDFDYLGGLEELTKSLLKAKNFEALEHFKEISRIWLEVKAY